MNLQRLKLMRSAARVARFHTTPTIRGQSVGEHTFGLIAILREIADDEHPLSVSLLVRALEHDAPEAITGDVPSPVKWRFSGLEAQLRTVEDRLGVDFDIGGSLIPYERTMLKFADLLELSIYSIEEVDMGNRHMAVMAFNALNAIKIRNLFIVTSAANELYNEVALSFHNKCGTATPEVDTWHGLPLVIKGVNS
jgi:hypothetical protein